MRVLPDSLPVGRRLPLLLAAVAACVAGCNGRPAGQAVRASGGDQHGAFDLELRETAGIDRQGETVRAGLPFPPGVLQKPASVRVVLSDGREVPSQRSALSAWPDGSVRWLELVFQPSVVAGGVGHYRVEFSPRLKAARVQKPLLASSERGVISVNTGKLRLEIAETGGALQAWFDRDDDGKFSPQEQVLAGPGLESFVELDALVPNAPAGSFAGVAGAMLEEAGPLRAAVAWRGWHVGAGGRVCPYVIRLEAFRGSARLRLVRTAVLSEPPAQSRVAASGMALVLQPGRAPPPELRLVQQVVAGGEYPDFAGFKTRSRLWEGRKPLSEEGSRAFLDLRTESLSLTAAVPRPQEDAPWELRVDPSGPRLVASFWLREALERSDARSPDRRENSRFVEFSRTESCERFWKEPAADHGQGAARTHELWLGFSPSGNGAGGEGMQLAARAAAPLTAWPGAAWLRRSRVFGDFEGVPADGGAEDWERGGERLKAWLRRHQRERFGWLGLWDYGDYQTVFRSMDGLDIGERWWQWSGPWAWMQGRGGLSESLLVPWLRSGRAVDWDLFRAAACHNLDVDTVHGPAPRGQLVGATHGPGATHWSSPAALAWTCPAAWLDLYYLAGEKRGMEALRELIDSLGDRTIADFAVPDEPWSGDQAGYLRATLAAHEAFGEPCAPKASAALAYFAALGSRELGTDGWARDLAPALIRYHRYSGDPIAARLIERGTRAALNQNWPPEPGSVTVAALAPLEGCAYAWRLSRDRFFLDRGRVLSALSACRAAAAVQMENEAEPPPDLVTDTRVMLELGTLPYVEAALRDAAGAPAARAGAQGPLAPGAR